MSTIKRKKTENGIPFSDIFHGIMLAVVVGIMPLIVRFELRPTPSDLAHLSVDATHHDVFAYWKTIFLTIPAIAMAFYVIADWLTGGKIPTLKQYLLRAPIILGASYLLFVIISAFASSYSTTAWFGTVEREEGALMWIIYFTVFASAMYYVREPKFTRPILWGLIFSSTIMGLIGAGQLIGRDFFDTRVATFLVTAGTDAAEMGTVFDIAHGTLYNPNTFGKYTAMITPILLIAGFTHSGKLYEKIFMLVGGVLMLVGIFASSSLGGLIGIITAVTVVVVTYVTSFLYSRICNVAVMGQGNTIRIGITFLAIAAVTTLALIFIPPLNNRFTTLLNRMQEAAAAETVSTERVSFDQDTIYAYRGESRLFALQVLALPAVISNDSDDTQNLFELTTPSHSPGPSPGEWFALYDSTGQAVQFSNYIPGTADNLSQYTFDVPGYGNVIVQRGDNFFIVLPSASRQTIPFFLTFREGVIYGVRPGFDYTIDFGEPIPTWGFVGRETWGSGRGYIWSRTFPLMPRRAIIGSGPDTFINVFPNHDMAGLQLTFNNPYQIVDKAHNLFMQTWINTGGISAILLFGLFGFYIITTFASLVKAKAEPLFCYGLRLGLLSGISAFVMSSMATDSTIGSTGVFFVLLGMGFGLNYFIAKRKTTA